jgi:hypothetical protein
VGLFRLIPRPGSRPSPHRATTRDAARRAAAEHVCRAVRAHRPRLLRVLVNGFEMATHEINGAATRVTQTVSATEPVWLVEVYSEQDVCLASLDVWPRPEAPAEQRATVALADDRWIEIVLSFLRPWPTLHLAYEDPALAMQPSIAAADYTVDEESRLDSPAIAPARTSWRVSSRAFQPWQGWSPWWWAVTMAVAAWLLFFTPGTPVSAAERIWSALAAILAGEATPARAPIPRGEPARQRDTTLPAQPKPREPVSSPSPSAVAPDVLRELEVDVLTVLQARQELSGQRIQVMRASDSVTVEGLVEGGDSDDLARALRAVAHGAALRVHLTTPADLMGSRPAGTSSPSSLRAVALGKDAIPAADDLRLAVVSRDDRAAAAGAPIENVETAMHRIANDGLRHSRTAFLEAATLSTLADRFDAVGASAMSATTSGKWRALLTEQADRVTRAVDQLRALLEPVFLTYDDRAAPGSQPAAPSLSPGGSGAPGRAPDRAADLAPDGAPDRLGSAGEARRIADDLREVERATRAALAVAEVAPGTIELRERTFWQRLAATSDRIAALRQRLTTR